MTTGGEVRSPADGVVSFSGVVVNRKVLSIDHGAGYISSFEPVVSDLVVGDEVSAGDVIAHQTRRWTRLETVEKLVSIPPSQRWFT